MRRLKGALYFFLDLICQHCYVKAQQFIQGMNPFNPQRVAYSWSPYGQILPVYLPLPDSQTNFAYFPFNYSPLTVESRMNQAPHSILAPRQPLKEENSLSPLHPATANKPLPTKPSLRSVPIEPSVSKAVQTRNGRERRPAAHSGYPTELLINPKRNTDRFIKKNTESNIVNQIFSYLWSPEKSQPCLEKIFDEELIPTFYEVMKNLKGSKIQLNRELLLRLTRPEEWSGNGVLKKRAEEVGQKGAVAFRRLVLLYLRCAGYSSILTSKKMNPGLWSVHLQKCRELIRDLFRGDY